MTKILSVMTICFSFFFAQGQTSSVNLPSQSSRAANSKYRLCSSQEDYTDYLEYFLQKKAAQRSTSLPVIHKIAQSMSLPCQRQFPLFKKTKAALEKWGLPAFAVEKVTLDLFHQKIKNSQKLEEVLNAPFPEELKKFPIGVLSDLLGTFTKEPIFGTYVNFNNYLLHGNEYMKICIREIYKNSVEKCRQSLPDIFSEYSLYSTITLPTMAQEISKSYDSVYNTKLPATLQDKGKIVSNILKLGPGAGEAFTNAVRNEKMRTLHKENPEILLESALILSLKGFSWQTGP